MRNQVLKYGSLGIILAALPLVGGLSEDIPAEQHAVPAVTLTNAPAQTNTLSVTLPEPEGNGEPPAASVEKDAAELENAPVQAISTEKPLPPNVKPSEPVSEVLRLADSGVDQSVLMAYINNATNRFNLGADEIIYLNDMGVPGNLVTAMIQHDQGASDIQPPAVTPDTIAPLGTSVAADPNQFATDALPPMDSSGQYAPMPDPSALPTEVSSAPEGYPPPDGSYPYEDGGAPPDVASDSAFYDTLAPYGTWVNVAGYGNCWQPSAGIVDPGWQPYFNCGRWVYSDCGWYWLSGYSWGWAPFHYGRWFRHNQLGWCWAPGRVWGPSWVAWRYSGGYCGWAPLPPCAWYRPGIGLTYRGRGVQSSFGFGLTPRSYAFVAFNNFYNNRLPAVAIPQKKVSGFFTLTTPSAGMGFSHNRVINNGVPPKTVANFSRVPTHRVTIHEVTRATGSQGGRVEQFASKGNALSVLRPTAPLAAGSKVNVRAPQPVAPRGNGHTFNSQPSGNFAGTSHNTHATGFAGANNPATHAPNAASNSANHFNNNYAAHNNSPAATSSPGSGNNGGTAWRDIPRSTQSQETSSDAYQRWKQRVTPTQTPWYLPNASSSGSHVTEKTSRFENHQAFERPSPRALDNGVVRSGPPANSAVNESRSFQYSAPRTFEAPKREFTPQPSFSAHPNNPTPSPRVESPVQMTPRAVSPPAQSFSPPAVRSAPAPSAPTPSVSPSHSPSGSGRWGR